MDLRSGNCIPLESISILHASSFSVASSNPVMNINLTTDRVRSLEDECEPDPLFDHAYISMPEDLTLSEITADIVYYIGGFVVRHLKKKKKYYVRSALHLYRIIVHQKKKKIGLSQKQGGSYPSIR